VKVLADTCVWSLSLRRKNGAEAMKADEKQMVAVLAEAIRDGRVVIVGPVRQELLSGIKHVEQFEKLRAHLEAFADEPIVTADYVKAARLDNLCRSRGVQCGEVDILLCAVAMRNRWTLLTNDAGIVRCMEAIEADEKYAGRRLRE
jgi:hypothetical protein